VPIHVQELGADLMAFPGHKGLLGPLGTGVLYVRAGMEHRLATIKEGGTGTVSEQPVQPASMPDKYEVGSHNSIGLSGLSEGVAWLLRRGVNTIRTHDEKLCKLFLDTTAGVAGLRVYGPRDPARRCGVFSVNVAGMLPVELAGVLEDEFGLLTRPGVHCAPLAHQTIGTHPTGTCRLSFGPFTTERHVRTAAEALTDIAQRVAEHAGR
jgi:selenocysteine lyase/cysteine desulfurase